MAGSSAKTAVRGGAQIGKNATPEQVVTASAGSGISRIIPLNNGLHCYFSDPRDGRNHHLRTDSSKFVELYRELSGLGLERKLDEEISALCVSYPNSSWPAVAKSLTTPAEPTEGS